MKRCRLKRYNFQIKNKMNKENKTLDKHEHGYSLDFITLKRARELTAKMYKAFK
jgi:hypothetical protein